MSNLDKLDKAIASDRAGRDLTDKPVEVERRDAPDFVERDWREQTPLPQREDSDISV